jgi:hypothetical protein
MSGFLFLSWARRDRSAVRAQVPAELETLDGDPQRARRASALATAARVTTRDRNVRRAYVVLNERPSYDEIVEYRRIVERAGLTMSVDGTGTVSIRREVESGAEGRAARPAREGAGA